MVLALLFLEYVVRTIPSSYSYKKELLISQQDRIQTLIIGLSYAMDGINPEHIDSYGFNIANYSEDYYYSYKILEYYVKEIPQLNNVILGTGYNTLDYQLVKGDEFWRSKFYQDNYNIPKNEKTLKINDYSYVFTYGLKKALNMIFNPKRNISKIQDNGWQMNKGTKEKYFIAEKVNFSN